MFLFSYIILGQTFLESYSLSFHLFAYHFQESLVVHLFVGDILAIVEDGIGGDGCRSVLCLLLALQMDGLERNTFFFGDGFKDGHILPVERALVGIVQDVATFFNMRMLCTFLETWNVGFFRKRKVPKLDTVVRFIADRETLVLEEFRVGQKRLLLCR